MLLMPNKKKVASIIVSGLKPSYVQKLGEASNTGSYKLPEQEGPMADTEMGLEAAMDDLIVAITAKSPRKAAEAFKAAMAICDASEDAMEEMTGED
jgi:hypothetical protein